MADAEPGSPIPPDREPSLAVGPQWPDGHVLEGALVLEHIRDRVEEWKSRGEYPAWWMSMTG